jgi:hypothetical protein
MHALKYPRDPICDLRYTAGIRKYSLSRWIGKAKRCGSAMLSLLRPENQFQRLRRVMPANISASPNAGSCNALESLRLDYHCRDQIGRSHCHELDRLGLNAYLNTGRRISHTCMYEFIVPVCCINMTLIERFSSLRRV